MAELKDKRAGRLAITAVAAAVMLVAALAFAYVGGAAPSSRRVPTIVTDRPVQAAQLAQAAGGSAVPPASATGSPGAAPVAPAGSTPAAAPQSAAPKSGASRNTASASRQTPTAADPAGTAVASASSAPAATGHEPSDDDHEVVLPQIRDDEHPEEHPVEEPAH